MDTRKYFLPLAVIALSIMFMPLAFGRSSAVAGDKEINPIIQPGSSTDINSAPPTTPPDSSKISVNPPNADGYALVTGAAFKIGRASCRERV